MCILLNINNVVCRSPIISCCLALMSFPPTGVVAWFGNRPRCHLVACSILIFYFGQL